MPVWTDNGGNDACFERMAELFGAAVPARRQGGREAGPGDAQRPLRRPHAGPLKRRGLPTAALELQMLYGMAERLRAAWSAVACSAGSLPLGEMILGRGLPLRTIAGKHLEPGRRASGGFSEDAPDEKLSPRRTPPRPARETIKRPRAAAPRRHVSMTN